MKEVLEEILDLQPQWTGPKTDAMDRRGQLIRHGGPDWLREFSPQLAGSIGIPLTDLGLEGRDGTGPKTEVPWFRFYSRERSPSATVGWYCVYLFDTEGKHAYLSLGHGSTEWTGVDFKPRPHADLIAMAEWAREKVTPLINDRDDLHFAISLQSRRSNLGPAYEAGTVCAISYDREAIPPPSVLTADALFMASLLSVVYRAETLEPIAGMLAPEIVELVESAEKIAGKRTKGGQGFRLTAEHRRAVESRAMEVAQEYLQLIGCTDIEDVSRKESFDLRCTSANKKLTVEVKGTTSSGQSIVLTKNEVLLHQEQWPNNALIVVSSIRLQKNGDRVIAVGGDVHAQIPWQLNAEGLSPISYIYTV